MGEVGDCLPSFGLSPSIQCVADSFFSATGIVGSSLLIRIFLLHIVKGGKAVFADEKEIAVVVVGPPRSNLSGSGPRSSGF